ncbi:hypothetical protein RND81_11G178500 [Saponaria officinalis]|uniref:Uncharacterized protein n=1 Tax=Saponaria officinalis TaxID=3572 RepID=A0AAW1HP13_SAPOF
MGFVGVISSCCIMLIIQLDMVSSTRVPNLVEALAPVPESIMSWNAARIQTHHHVDKSEYCGDVIICGLFLAIAATLFFYIRATRKDCSTDDKLYSSSSV